MFLFAAASFFSLMAFAQKADDVLKVNAEKIELGKVKQGVPVTTFFELKNIGNKPIVVEDVRASCGCTKPEKPADPILPGQSYKLKVEYNAAAMGRFEKDVTIVIAGVELPKIVKIAGEVVTAEAFDAYTREKEKEKSKSNGKSGK